MANVAECCTEFLFVEYFAGTGTETSKSVFVKLATVSGCHKFSWIGNDRSIVYGNIVALILYEVSFHLR